LVPDPLARGSEADGGTTSRVIPPSISRRWRLRQPPESARSGRPRHRSWRPGRSRAVRRDRADGLSGSRDAMTLPLPCVGVFQRLWLFGIHGHP